jgi:hypothetical protein
LALFGLLPDVLKISQNDTLVQPAEAPDGGYASAMVKSWDGIRIGTLDPEQFYFEADVVKPDKNATIQMVLF